MAAPGLKLHASAVVVREAGILIRGPSGAGKTSLALALLRHAGRAGWFGRLVADDTVLMEASNGRLLARPHVRTAGLVERRGIGVTAIEHEPACVLRIVVDLVRTETSLPRLPDPELLRAVLIGVELPRLALPTQLAFADGTERVLACLENVQGRFITDLLFCLPNLPRCTKTAPDTA